jgi:hypothetical protein
MSNRPGPAGAESAGGTEAVPPSVVSRFAAEGFKFVGRIRLAHEMGPRPQPADSQPEPEADHEGNWRIKAVRCTAEGDVYIGRRALAPHARAAPRMRAAPPCMRAHGGRGRMHTSRGRVHAPRSPCADAACSRPARPPGSRPPGRLPLNPAA